MVFRKMVWVTTVLMALCFLQMNPIVASAEEKPWKVVDKDGTRYAVLRDHPKLELHLFTHGGWSEVLAFAPSYVRSDIWLLIWFAGAAGTSNMAYVYEAYVIDIKNSKVLGEATWKVDGYPSYGFSQPEWLWKERELVITRSGNEKIIPLPKDPDVVDEITDEEGRPPVDTKKK